MFGIPTWFWVICIVSLCVLVFLASCYKKVKGQGWMLVINGASKTRATRNGTFIIPLIDVAEHVRVTDRAITIHREGRERGWLDGDDKQGLSCNDGVRVNLVATFYVKFPQYDEDTICSITNRLTTAVINDDAALKEYLSPILNETLKNVVIKHDYERLMTDRDAFSNEVQKALANQLHGLVLEQVAIKEIQHSHIDSHDPDNVYDAKGIKKIKEITSEKALEATKIEQRTQTETKKFEVEGENQRKQLELEDHQRSEEIERSKRIVTQEQNRLAEEQEIETQRALEEKRIQTAQDLEQAEQNKIAAVEGSKVDVDRKVKLAKVAAKKEGDLAEEDANRELVERSTKTAIQRETALLQESEIKAQRVEVERQTAVQEEETLDLRTERSVARNQVEVVGEAEAKATATATSEKIASETALVVETQSAERQRISAQANFDVQEMDAKAIERRAAASIEEESAQGIAEAKVAEAKGKAEATARREAGLAEAEVIDAQGLAKANSEKAIREAMNVDPETRDHEVRLAEMQINKEIALHQIDKQAEVGVAQAKGMADAYSGADITLLGNNNDFANAIMGARVNAKVQQENPVFGKRLSQYEAGDADIVSDLKDIMQKSNAGDLLNLALASQLGKGDSADPASLIAAATQNALQSPQAPITESNVEA